MPGKADFSHDYWRKSHERYWNVSGKGRVCEEHAQNCQVYADSVRRRGQETATMTV